MKVVAVYTHNGAPVKIREYETKKEIQEHMAEVGYRKSKLIKDTYYGCIRDECGTVKDVTVRIYSMDGWHSCEKYAYGFTN